MANVYYGDGGLSAVTGNWNTVSNWFSGLGVVCNCGSSTGTPLGRLPTAGDVVYLTCALGNTVLSITTGPSTPFAGSLNGIPNTSPYGSYGTKVSFASLSNFTSVLTGTINANYGTWILPTNAQTYNQAINVTNTLVTLPSNSTYNGALNGPFIISGGTFTGNNSLSCNYGGNISGSPTFSGTTTFVSGVTVNYVIGGTPTFTNNVYFSTGVVTITGGTFGSGSPVNLYTTDASSTVKIQGGTFGTDSFFNTVAGGGFQITGGTWTPAATVTVNASTGRLVTTNLPKDPGFALGGTYSPVITVSNIPQILGAGLP
jgi:hypothetical protein